MGDLPKVYVEGAFGTIGAMVWADLASDGRIDLLAKIPRGEERDVERRLALAEADLAIVCAEGEALASVEAMVGPSAKYSTYRRQGGTLRGGLTPCPSWPAGPIKFAPRRGRQTRAALPARQFSSLSPSRGRG